MSLKKNEFILFVFWYLGFFFIDGAELDLGEGFSDFVMVTGDWKDDGFVVTDAERLLDSGFFLCIFTLGDFLIIIN